MEVMGRHIDQLHVACARRQGGSAEHAACSTMNASDVVVEHLDLFHALVQLGFLGGRDQSHERRSQVEFTIVCSELMALSFFSIVTASSICLLLSSAWSSRL